uniref:Nucleotide-diphospho-sugar transferase domain-containing protein n=1 Tax=Plectus sambesii TaxID=2011161 RepID=A0A914VMD8_9BILA
MLQQDTVCRDDLFRLAAEKDHPDADAVFDQMGFDPNSSRAQVINGANFYVRSTDHSRRLFADVSWWLTHFFVQDIGVLMMHCRSRRGLKCFYFPYKLVSGWEWIASEQRNGPFWMQVDGESDTGGKIDRFKEYGFYFIHDNGSCDAAAVIKARSAIAHGNVPKVISPSKKQHLRAAALAEGAFRLPIIGEYLKTYVLLGIYFIDHLI